MGCFFLRFNIFLIQSIIILEFLSIPLKNFSNSQLPLFIALFKPVFLTDIVKKNQLNFEYILLVSSIENKIVCYKFNLHNFSKHVSYYTYNIDFINTCLSSIKRVLVTHLKFLLTHFLVLYQFAFYTMWQMSTRWHFFLSRRHT